ncbi:hypothetical protein HMI55_006414 [Coelomomyces lativittatus]|nr:hypothetical protein HMI55_006414 [Coelomomyces lativittatus]
MFYFILCSFLQRLGEDRKNVEKPVPLKYLNDKGIVEITAGGMHNLALSKSGIVYSWGVNDEGALGREVPVDEECDVAEIPNSEAYKFVKLAAGDSVSLGIDVSGNVYAWGTFRGDLMGGEIGFSKHTLKQVTPTLLPFFSNEHVVDVAAGDNHALVLTHSGHVYAWGNCEHGQTGFLCHHSLSGLAPRKLKFKRGRKIQRIACGSFHSLCIDDLGEVWTFGLNNFGQCGVDPQTVHSFYTPHSISLPNGIAKDVAAGMHHSFILLEDGDVLCFGKNEDGQLGLGDDAPSVVLQPTLNPYLHHIKKIAAGTYHSIAITEQNEGYYFGENVSGQLGISSEIECIKLPQKYDFSKSNAKILSAACGAQHSVLLVYKP